MSERETIFEHSGPATLEFRCAVGGNHDESIRWCCIEQGPYAQYDKALFISVLRPRKRKKAMYCAYDDGLVYYRLVANDSVLFDSRTILPLCKLTPEQEAQWGKWG